MKKNNEKYHKNDMFVCNLFFKLDTGSLFNTSFSGIRYMTLTTGHQHLQYKQHHQIIIHH